MVANVFVLGLDELNLETLRALPRAEQYAFHQLLTVDELQHQDEIPLGELLDKADRQLDAFDGRVDAIVGYWDFPVSSMVPILAQRRGLRSPSLEAIVKCEHKYWSRLEQRNAIDEHPPFAIIHLDDDEPEPPGLAYPFWVKPVKAFSSELAFRVEDDASFRAGVASIREGIGRVGQPFDFVLEHLDLPPEIAAVGGQACLAEGAITGAQVTLEGYSFDGTVNVYGVVDSLTYPDSSSFLRFQYPSGLPSDVTDRMADVARRVIKQIGLDGATFNIEFFWDADTDAINVLEVNPRHSQSHARLFEYVDGISNHRCMVELALGRDPGFPRRAGRYEVAAKWFLRRFAGGVVRRSPTADEVAQVEEAIPGVTVDIVAHEGDRLSELHDQDAYSYKLANLYIGAHDEAALAAKYEACVEALPFAFGREGRHDPCEP